MSRQSVSASCAQGNVWVCVWNWQGLVWEGFFDEATFSFWGSVFYEGSRIWI